MVLWKSIVLGIVQGLTEFLPVSSSGHLVVVSELLKASTSVAYDVALHAGSLLALLIFFWRDVVGLFEGFLATFRASAPPAVVRKKNVFWILVLAILPSGIAGFLLTDTIDKAFSSITLAGAMFLVTGLLLFLQHFSATTRTIREVTWKDALAIGIGQTFALLPGLSRSGTTMSVGVYRGIRQEDAAHFSFLMAIPTIAGAALAKVKDLVQAGLNAGGYLDIGIGVVVSALTGLLAIGLLLRVARKGKMEWFAVYCTAAGVFTLVAHAAGLL